MGRDCVPNEHFEGEDGMHIEIVVFKYSYFNCWLSAEGILSEFACLS